MKVYKMFITCLLALFYSSLVGQNNKVYKSLDEAKRNAPNVKHLAPNDFDPSKDGFVLTEFPNLETLDLSVSKNVSIVPLGFKKLIKLKNLNVSHTEIGLLYPYIKKLSNLEMVVAISSSISSKELKKIENKLGVNVVTEVEDIPKIFKPDELTSETPEEVGTPVEQQAEETNDFKGNNTFGNNVQKASYKVFSIKEVNESNAAVVRNVYVSSFGGDFERLIEFIPKMTSIEKLRMGAQFSDFPYIPKELNQLKTLKFLEVVTKKEVELPELDLPNLDTLILPPTKVIPLWVKSLKITNLTIYTRLGNLSCSDLPVDGLTSLKLICDFAEEYSGSSVSATTITGLDKISNLKNFELNVIRPEKKSIKVNPYSLPNNLGSLDKLNKLVLKGVRVSDDVSSIGKLVKLQELYIQTKTIPSSFKNLTQLKSFKNIHWLGEGIYNTPATGLTEVLSAWTELEELLVCPSEGLIDLSGLKRLNKVFIDFSQSFEASQIVFAENNALQEVSIKFSKAGVDAWKTNASELKKLILFCEGQKNSLPTDILDYKDSITDLKIYHTQDEINFEKEDFNLIKSYQVK